MTKEEAKDHTKERLIEAGRSDVAQELGKMSVNTMDFPHHFQYRSLSELIQHLFPWQATPQGRLYWEEVHNDLFDKENK